MGGEPAGEGFSQPRKESFRKEGESHHASQIEHQECPWVWQQWEGQLESDFIGVLGAGLALKGVELKEWEGGGGAGEERGVWMSFALHGGQLGGGAHGAGAGVTACAVLGEGSRGEGEPMPQEAGGERPEQ